MNRPLNSRRLFRQLQQESRKAPGSEHSLKKAEGRGRTTRERSAWLLIAKFLELVGSQRLSLAIALTGLTCSTTLALVPPAATKVLIDYVLSGQPLPQGTPNWIPREPKTLLVVLVVSVIGISLIKMLIEMSSRWRATLIATRVQLSVRRKAFVKIMQLPLAQVQRLKSGGATSLIRQDAASVGQLLFGLIYNPWSAIVQLIGSLIVLAWVDWKLLLGAVLLIPIVYVTHRAWIAKIRPQHKRIRTIRERADGVTTETFAGIRVVRGFSGAKVETSRIMRLNHLIGRQTLRVWWWSRAIEQLWGAFIALATAALMLFGGWRVLDGALSLGDLMMFLAFLMMLLVPMATLANSAAQFQEGLSGLDRILDLMAEPRELEPNRGTILIDAKQIAGAIEFDHVSFRYEGTESDTLSDICLSIRAGETVALVGPSGAGKTTLCNLVARFYDPQSGNIRIDGRPLRELEVERYRRALAIVEQDVFLFDGTIADNIRYGNRNASHEAVVAAALAAHASQFIEQLPQGYDTVIGERGVKLSGGQRQRLAIARAILADPAILILDEATSNLDTASERAIQEGLADLLARRTCLVIAHRLSTIASADRIVVIEGGRIVEQGDHAALMQHHGRYREMVRMQTSVGESHADDSMMESAS